MGILRRSPIGHSYELWWHENGKVAGNRFNGLRSGIAMVHSYTKIFVHVVWATKNRERILTKEVRPLLQKHIVQLTEPKSQVFSKVYPANQYFYALGC